MVRERCAVGEPVAFGGHVHHEFGLDAGPATTTFASAGDELDQCIGSLLAE